MIILPLFWPLNTVKQLFVSNYAKVLIDFMQLDVNPESLLNFTLNFRPFKLWKFFFHTRPCHPCSKFGSAFPSEFISQHAPSRKWFFFHGLFSLMHMRWTTGVVGNRGGWEGGMASTRVVDDKKIDGHGNIWHPSTGVTIHLWSMWVDCNLKKIQFECCLVSELWR